MNMFRWLKRKVLGINYSKDINNYNEYLKKIAQGFTKYNPKLILNGKIAGKGVFEGVYMPIKESVAMLKNMKYNVKYYGLNENATSKMSDEIDLALKIMNEINVKLSWFVHHKCENAIADNNRFLRILELFFKHNEKSLKLTLRL